jgi:hypothetical protein
VFTLIYRLIRLMMALVMVAAWCTWALVVLVVGLIASATGNHAVSRRWQRSLRWRFS